MFTYRFADYLHFSRRNKLFLLAFLSLSGIVLGAIVSYTAAPLLYSLMRGVLTNPVSIVGLLIVTCLPLLITAIIVLLSKPCLFLLHCFVKNLSYSFIRNLICISFAHAGWLVAAMLLFSDTIVMCALHWFWIRHIHYIRKSARKDLLICLLFSLIACFVDYSWVSVIYKPY